MWLADRMTCGTLHRTVWRMISHFTVRLPPLLVSASQLSRTGCVGSAFEASSSAVLARDRTTYFTCTVTIVIYVSGKLIQVLVQVLPKWNMLQSFDAHLANETGRIKWEESNGKESNGKTLSKLRKPNKTQARERENFLLLHTTVLTRPTQWGGEIVFRQTWTKQTLEAVIRI